MENLRTEKMAGDAEASSLAGSIVQYFCTNSNTHRRPNDTLWSTSLFYLYWCHVLDASWQTFLVAQ